MTRTNSPLEAMCMVGKGKGLLLCIAAMAALLLGLFIMAEPTHAATTFTVNSTGDENDLDFPDGAFDGSTANTCDVTSAIAGNQCTLRAAIQQAKVTTGADTIAFSISGDGPHTIYPTSVLPTITGEVTIDGYTQGDSTTGTMADDAVENTIPLTESGSNAVLKIELNGTNAGTGSDKNGLTIACCPNGGPGRVVVRGLVINSFEDAGIALIPHAWPRIEGNFIGTNPAGDTDLGNGGAGIKASSVYNGEIGAHFYDATIAQHKAARNLISGNGGDGVLLSDSGSYTVKGNLIGTAADGTTAIPNAGDGVLVNGASNNTIGDHMTFGGVSSGAGRSSNVIAHNGGRGIAVVGGASNTILDNLIFSNGGLGIDLVGGTETNGVTQNDPQDADLGANNLQNYPRLLTATTDGATTTITGKLNSKPGQQFSIQFFASAQVDPSGFGEGEEFLGQKGDLGLGSPTSLTTDSSGDANFSFTVNQDLSGKFVTAIANFYGVVEDGRVTESGGTSEFSEAVQVTEGPPTFEGPSISDIANQTVNQDNDAGPIPFTVRDADTLAATLEVRGTSSNTVLVPNANIAFGGTGENRTVTITPAAGKSGTATITVKVSDGTTEVTDTFVLTVLDTAAPTATAPKHSFTTLSTLGSTTVPVKLTWSATDNTGGSGIASYQLQQSVSSINGGAYTNVTLPSATATTISRSLAPGTNTYRYRVAAKDKAGNVSAWVAGPSFKVSTYQESSSAIVDTGSWTTSALSNAYGGSVQYASALGRNATFTVPVGSKNVEWVSNRGPNRGKAQVWLDGVQQDANPTLTGIQPFDLYSSTAQARKVVFSKAVSSTTSHKLEVRVLGQKNASSTSTRVDIDAFVRTS